MKTVFDDIRSRFLDMYREKDLLDERVAVRARALTAEEAIGNPEDKDFPLQKGKERLMQAEFRDSLGQAFTDRYGDFEGTLASVLQADLTNNFRRAVFTATLNAALRYLNEISGTVHCKDKEPNQCAQALAGYLWERYGRVKVLQVGFQPKIVEHVGAKFSLRVLDMDSDNIGTEKYGVIIESPEKTEDAKNWADLFLVTGTTLVNGTIDLFLGSKPVLFYGTTIAGAARLMGWERFCEKSR